MSGLLGVTGDTAEVTAPLAAVVVGFCGDLGVAVSVAAAVVG